jgi:hypothetical protein
MSAFIQTAKGDVFGPSGAVDGNIALFNGTSGKTIKDGRVPPVGVIVGTTDTQTLTNKTIDSPTILRATAPYRPSGLLVSNTQLTTLSSAGTTIIWDYTIPAGMISKDGDMLRVYFHNVCGGTGAVTRGARLLFGGNVGYDLTSSSTAVQNFFNTVMIGRMSSTQLRFSAMRGTDSNAVALDNVILSSMDFTVSILARLYIYVTTVTSGTYATHYMSSLEFMPAP